MMNWNSAGAQALMLWIGILVSIASVRADDGGVSLQGKRIGSRRIVLVSTGQADGNPAHDHASEVGNPILETPFVTRRFEIALLRSLAAIHSPPIPSAVGGVSTVEVLPTPAGQRSVLREDLGLAPAKASVAENAADVSLELELPITESLEKAAHFDPINDFSPAPLFSESECHDAAREAWVYDAKSAVPTQHPWVEWGRVFYGDGITPRGRDWFGDMNLIRPQFYVYGDFRSGIQSGRNATGRADNWANRLNLDLDLKLTDTERFHAFVGPIENQNQFTRVEWVDGDLEFRDELNVTPATGFFEGDLGVMIGALQGTSAPVDLPISLGLMPLLFQNGIWMEDAVTGLAFSLPARHSNLLNWANYDATFFAVFDQLNSPAFASDSDAQAFGSAWFIEAYGGYIEAGYAYLNERDDHSLSYHNATVSFTRRYFDRISNSVRVIVNAGQGGDRSDRTADGGLLLYENSWITAAPLTVVPYANLFYGWGTPQSVARAGISGGILRNTGINFDTDGLNGFPTLDVSGADTAGGAFGVDLIGEDLDRQLLLEFAYLAPHGDSAVAQGHQFGLGSRYQFPISHSTLLRFDAMMGWRGNEEDVYGTRMEFRWKF